MTAVTVYRGSRSCVAEVRHLRGELAAARAELEARRWTVRAELRTHATVADPNADDYPGTDTVL